MRKPIKIDWDELESAFDSRREDLVYYLDLVTGEVVLEGEGEEDDFDDGEDAVEEAMEAASGNGRGDSTTRLTIEPPDEEDEIAWMEDFAEEAGRADPELAARLGEALDGDGAVEAFREVLRHHVEERDRWFAYRADRLHEAIEAWLDAHKVHAAEPPPWRAAGPA